MGASPTTVGTSKTPAATSPTVTVPGPNRPKRDGIRRANSVPSASSPGKNRAGLARWGRLRSLLTHVANERDKSAADEAIPQGAVMPYAVNITDELIVGGLSTQLLRLWFERGERDQRRIPILFHRLKIRVSDSIHPLHDTKSVFRIECEYANGAFRWVIYRQLRDFVRLHTKYRLSNAVNWSAEKLPEFPKRGMLPYRQFLRLSADQGRQAEFARHQRQALEDYIIELIRAVMFHPSSNRLAHFLEISALSIHLAQSGGTQYKAGFLQIEAQGNNGPGFGRRSATWSERRVSRWCAVRESYLVALIESGELAVWDVFLLDSDFKIERPTRYYRQGLNLLHGEAGDGESRIPTVVTRSEVHLSPREPWSSTVTTDRSVASTSKIALEGDVSKHTFYIVNSQMRLKLNARTERQMLQWITALEKAAGSSHFTGSNRFGSFAPIHLNVSAQWLVDGRDYFWNLSRAILMASECIYIHDWWLSPELQMRRPKKERYRLDKLLERKAREGVKIYIIVYKEVSNRTTPTDSRQDYTKQQLTHLHRNIMIQRSPSHFQTGTYYWAHHEKLCVIDETIAFMGGLDLCFGRWDTPQHVLVDDAVMDPDNIEIWQGKDYSNPRVQDFHTLNKPLEDMYDRTKVPRMPWHDVGMQIVGQPARDLCRHFVERWNFLLRIKNHSRTMPFLLPPPMFKASELTEMGLTGTCELQICRSAGPWSLGTPLKTEQSIQNAYLKAIQMSEHFVYIENQFFVTSTMIDDLKVENRIGDAIVSRIIRAHRSKTSWKCCVLIPLLPGFTFPIDHTDASAVRIILECQNRTIARGPNSIYGRLRKEGIEPEDYFTVFSLRNWGKLRGDVLTTEQVYIHGKVCIVDDRLVIIGSANINERSLRGDRDSELAAVIRDTDLMEGYLVLPISYACRTMAGKPFKVGRFAHTLRVRLMREHLGVNVDGMAEEDLMARDPTQPEHPAEAWDPDREQRYGEQPGDVTHIAHVGHITGERLGGLAHTAKRAIDSTNGAEAMLHSMHQVAENMHLRGESVEAAEREAVDKESQMFSGDGQGGPGLASSAVPTLEEKIVMNHAVSEAPFRKVSTKETNSDIVVNDDVSQSRSEKVSTTQAHTEDGLPGAPMDVSVDPTTDDQASNAQSGVNDANEDEKTALRARSSLRKHVMSRLTSSVWTLPTPRPDVEPHGFEDPVCDSFWRDVWVGSAVHNTEIYRKVFHAVPDDLVTTWKQYKDFVAHHERLNKPRRDTPSPETAARMPSEAADEGAPGREADNVDPSSEDHHKESGVDDEYLKRRPTRRSEPFEKWERDEMENLLSELNGHLVLYPTRFLEGEDVANNFLFNADRLLPLPIYD
ncbi:phospholipase D [Fistulina hepatica ATCC 64428]|uniref:Phospholipase n=1 Tax=Fistulina hepatica ATCC 64428 TaxID=1128425 RepID=A0A0D7A1Z9_9AGAR|nr:phospholipase D [Fistulina hepatica ATCC 64428]